MTKDGLFDPETGAILFLSLLGLTLAICLLGYFVLTRLRREGGSERPATNLGFGQAIAAVLLFLFALMSTIIPYLALVPALMFFVFGLRLLFGSDRRRRDGGVVLLLLCIAWGIFTAIQADTLASKAEIRIDLLLTLPMMPLIGSLGWRVYASKP